MILVDTAVWIDHLHAAESRLVEQLALGSITRRNVVLDLLANLWQFPTAQHGEILYLVERQQLWGRGLSAVDAHLMAAVSMVEFRFNVEPARADRNVRLTASPCIYIHRGAVSCTLRMAHTVGLVGARP